SDAGDRPRAGLRCGGGRGPAGGRGGAGEGGDAMMRVTIGLLGTALAGPGFAQTAGVSLKAWVAGGTPNTTHVPPPGAAFFADTVSPDSGRPSAHGFAGCNIWHAQPDIRDPDEIQFGEIATTKKLCPEGDTMGIEGDYIRALSRVARWRLDGDALVLSGEETLLRLSPQAQR